MKKRILSVLLLSLTLLSLMTYSALASPTLTYNIGEPIRVAYCPKCGQWYTIPSSSKYTCVIWRHICPSMAKWDGSSPIGKIPDDSAIIGGKFAG